MKLKRIPLTVGLLRGHMRRLSFTYSCDGQVLKRR